MWQWTTGLWGSTGVMGTKNLKPLTSDKCFNFVWTCSLRNWTEMAREAFFPLLSTGLAFSLHYKTHKLSLLSHSFSSLICNTPPPSPRGVDSREPRSRALPFGYSSHHRWPRWWQHHPSALTLPQLAFIPLELALHHLTSEWNRATRRRRGRVELVFGKPSYNLRWISNPRKINY